MDHASNPANHALACTHSASYPAFMEVCEKVMDKKTLPIESASKMLGHGRIASTQLYAKIVNKKVEGDMRVLEGKLRFG